LKKKPNNGALIMRKILFLFAILLFSLPVFAVEDVTPNGTQPIQQTQQNTCTSADIAILKAQLSQMQANSMTATDFQTLEQNIYSHIDSYGLSTSANIIFVNLVLAIFLFGIWIILKGKGLI
jgi:hypothetical protein